MEGVYSIKVDVDVDMKVGADKDDAVGVGWDSDWIGDDPPTSGWGLRTSVGVDDLFVTVRTSVRVTTGLLVSVTNVVRMLLGPVLCSGPRIPWAYAGS